MRGWLRSATPRKVETRETRGNHRRPDSATNQRCIMQTALIATYDPRGGAAAVDLPAVATLSSPVHESQVRLLLRPNRDVNAFHRRDGSAVQNDGTGPNRQCQVTTGVVLLVG
jgi:hypothetical protein